MPRDTAVDIVADTIPRVYIASLRAWLNEEQIIALRSAIELLRKGAEVTLNPRLWNKKVSQDDVALTATYRKKVEDDASP